MACETNLLHGNAEGTRAHLHTRSTSREGAGLRTDNLSTATRGIRRHAWIILVCRPCPISVPPCVSKTLPSVYTCNSAPACPPQGE